MNRRKFIGKSFLRAIYFVCGLALAYPILSFITFRKKRKRVVVFLPEEQLAQVNYKKGVYLINHLSNIYAFSAKCTHLGCTLDFDPSSRRFRCPCHGSIFDLSGKRIAGPAKKDLAPIPIVHKANQELIVTLNL